MRDKYNVFFHRGPEIGLKTRVSRGVAWLDASSLYIQGRQASQAVKIDDIQDLEMFRLHGSMRVIRVDHREGRLFLAVVRFMVGQFALVNFFKTGELHNALARLVKSIGSHPADFG